MMRGDVWWAVVAGKRRPVLVLTRTEVIDVRRLVTVAEITTSHRGLAAEVELDPLETGLPQLSVVNCDGIYTIEQRSLDGAIGAVGPEAMARVCEAIGYALGC